MKRQQRLCLWGGGSTFHSPREGHFWKAGGLRALPACSLRTLRPSFTQQTRVPGARNGAGGTGGLGGQRRREGGARTRWKTGRGARPSLRGWRRTQSWGRTPRRGSIARRRPRGPSTLAHAGVGAVVSIPAPSEARGSLRNPFPSNPLRGSAHSRRRARALRTLASTTCSDSGAAVPSGNFSSLGKSFS